MTKTKKTYHHGDLRASLEAAAAQLILEDGVEGLSMRKLADRVGVSRSAPYHHFADKQRLLCAVAARGFELQAATMAQIPEGLGFIEQVNEFISRYVHWAVAYPQYYDLMFGRDVWGSGEPDEDFLQHSHGYFRSYVERVEAWQRAGHLPPEVEALRFAQVSWSTMHGLSRLLIDGIYVDPKATDAICQTATELFFGQLRPA
ncbi:MAG: TetR/AcrR family transcriptional regulator [Cellvibrionaceae bacterium]|nr:TetR/AcrR family transcriptional regulator [Cellvibrionaceae bacterium]